MNNLATQINTKQIELDMQLDHVVRLGRELQALIDQEDQAATAPSPRVPGRHTRRTVARPTRK